ncbi:hypothetical protein NDA14_005967 [Ustilago hordei]|nr:hypothetical protein NDA14_005967 [Ustilago hordei]
MSSSSSSAADARRKAEIEAKKAKLLEIRRQREERAQRLRSTATSSATSAALASDSASSAPNSSRKDLDDLVNSLISNAPGTRSSRAPLIGDPSSPRKSLLAGGSDRPSSDFGGSESEVPSTPSAATHTAPSTTAVAVSERLGPVELIDVQTELFELPRNQRVFYTKEVQTAALGPSDSEDAAYHPAGGVGAESRASRETDESLRAKIQAELAADQAARAQEDRLEREIAQQLRELTEEERVALYTAQGFSEFVEQSSKIVERALTDRYDYTKDYRITSDAITCADSASHLRLQRIFGGSGDHLFANRSVTAIDWSTKHPELCVVAYNRNDQDQEAPDGIVAVWNTHLAERPEFVFYAQTDVLSVCFSPFHPNLIVGGSYSGQILIWDTRSRQLPILKTPLSASGHTHPVYGLAIIGSANAHNLVSASTDGTLCYWMLDMLARPQETLELINTTHPKTDEVAVTTLGIADQETTCFLVGTEDGNLYVGNRYDRAGLKAGLNMAEVYKAHLGPVTGLHFHPLIRGGAVDFSDLFLTSSVDWTSKLWRLKPNSSGTSTAIKATGESAKGGMQALLTFEESNDYVYDVRWSPTHPAVFAQVDGTGRLDLFNLNLDTERPVASVFSAPNAGGANGNAGAMEAIGARGAKALNKLSWAKNGRKVATGGSDGVLCVYDVSEPLAVAGEDEFKLFQGVIGRLLSEGKVTAPSGGSVRLSSGL